MIIDDRLVSEVAANGLIVRHRGGTTNISHIDDRRASTIGGPSTTFSVRERDAGGRRGHYGRELARLVAARLLRRAGGDATVVVVFESDGYQSHARHDAGASV